MGHHYKGKRGGSLIDRLLGGGSHHGDRYYEDEYRREPSRGQTQTLIVCPKCKAKNAEHAKFCSECGESFSAAQGSGKCTSCQATLASDAKFCGECGAKQ